LVIGYNVEKVRAVLGEQAPVNSWDLLFKEENLAKLSQCGVAILDAPAEIVALTWSGARTGCCHLALHLASTGRSTGA
jgi:spermidine/putrescine-binding protein